MKLPPGYRVQYDPDVWALIGPCGYVVGRWVAGVPDAEIEAEAWRHFVS